MRPSPLLPLILCVAAAIPLVGCQKRSPSTATVDTPATQAQAAAAVAPAAPVEPVSPVAPPTPAPAPTPTPAAVKPPAPVAVQKAPLGDILNVSKTGDLYLCGQPTAGDIARLKEQGVKTVITLRTPGEVTQYDEAKAVGDAGLRFVSLPFKSAQEMDDALFDRTRALLNDASNYPIMLHCGSANRVAAVWITHRVLDQGVDAPTALSEAKLIGLKNAEMEARAMKYIQDKRAK